MLLNVGSGDHPAPIPWTNVDTYAGVNPDVVADVRELPYADGTIRAIYCGHLLEHLPLSEVTRALVEMHRVLRPGGQVCIVGPDYQRAREMSPVDDVLLDSIRDGGCRWPGDRHLWLSTGPLALAALQEVFMDAHEEPITEVAEFWPIVARAEWQFAITASRRAPLRLNKLAVKGERDFRAPERAIPPPRERR